MFSKEKPEALFCTHISNVTGYVLPIEEIFNESKRYGCINVLDTAQSMGLVEIRADLLKVDLIAFAGHKTLYGPFGIGGFVNVAGINMNPFICGGTGSDSLNLEMPSENEGRFEAASSNIVAIAGLNAAMECLRQHDHLEYEQSITQYLVKRLSRIRGVRMFLPQHNNHVGIVSFVVEGMTSEDVGLILSEDFDIAVRSGYHCAPYIHKYLKDEKYLGTVRIGLGQFTSMDDIDALIEAVADIAGGI